MGTMKFMQSLCGLALVNTDWTNLKIQSVLQTDYIFKPVIILK